MKHPHFSNRGQVLIIFVFGIIGLIGFTGLAIDGGNVYSDRRHAQNAADAAALAAAVTRINLERPPSSKSPVDCANIPSVPPPGGYGACASQVITAALNRAADNGYLNDISGSTVEVHTPPIDGPYSQASYSFDRNEYVQVIIYSHVDTFFARVLGIPRLNNRVEAVALARYAPSGKLYGGNSLVELRPHSGPGCGTESGGGGGDVYLGGSSGLVLDGGGIFVNSDNPDCALKITNTCPSITLKNGAAIQGIGGQFNGCTPPVLQHATDPYPYPPANPPVSPIPPAECGVIPRVQTFDADGVARYYPGHYTQLPPEKNVRLDPGVYCVDNLIKTTNSYSFWGDGVFMYVKPGGNFSFQGGTIQLVAPGMNFVGKPAAAIPPGAEPYKGYLIYVDESNWTGTAPNCIINGSSDTILRGVIYTPHCDVTIDGGSGTFGITAQVIAYTLSLQGSAVLNFTYEADKMPGVPEQNQTGIFR